MTENPHANDMPSRNKQPLTVWAWLVSIAAHALVLAGLSALVFISFSEQRDRPAIIPEARLGKIDSRMPLFAKSVRTPSAVPEKLLERQTEKHIASAVRNAPAPEENVDIVALRRADRPDRRTVGLGHIAPVAPKTRFFNTCGNAYSVVYVVDISGSMYEYLEHLKHELKLSLRDLQPMQKFHVIFFSSGEPVEGPARQLVWASDRNKRKYYLFIDAIAAHRKTDPRWAVKRAVDLNPDLVYLLTDGVFDRKLADQIIEWSRARKVKINTIAYVNERGALLLRRIAEHSGGVYRFVPESELP